MEGKREGERMESSSRVVGGKEGNWAACRCADRSVSVAVAAKPQELSWSPSAQESTVEETGLFRASCSWFFLPVADSLWGCFVLFFPLATVSVFQGRCIMLYHSTDSLSLLAVSR